MPSMTNAKSTNCVLYAILARTENLHFAVNGWFMHRRSHIVKKILSLGQYVTFQNILCQLVLQATIFLEISFSQVHLVHHCV